MTIIIIIIAIFAVGVIINNLPTKTNIIPIDEEETRERRRKLAEKFQKEAAEEEKKEIQKYGCTCTKSIMWWFDLKIYLIRIYEASQKILIKDDEYNFSDIIDVSFIDKVQNIGTIITTTTNNKNMAGRAIAGGLVAGGLGAAIGAVTARQESYSKNTNYDVHDYVILINTKILSKPLIELRIGNNIDQVNEIMATLNAVIAYNQSTNN